MTKFEEKMIDFADAAIDDRRNLYGVANTIEYLIDFGFTDDELYQLGFCVEDVEVAHENDLIITPCSDGFVAEIKSDEAFEEMMKVLFD